MSDENQPLMFANMETLVVKEAIANAVGIYTEELGRKLLGMTDEPKARSFIAEAWSFPCAISVYLLGTPEAVKKLWNKLRENVSLFDAIMASSSKFRGMYGDADWAELVKRQSTGLGIVANRGQYSAIDGALGQSLPSDTSTISTVLQSNPWLLFILILNYAPLTTTPSVLTAILGIVAKAKPNEASNIQ